MLIVSRAMTAKVGAQTLEISAKLRSNKRKKAPKPAIFTTVAMNRVTKLGLPSYTSGLQK